MGLGNWLRGRGNWIRAKLNTIVNIRDTRGGFRIGQSYDVGSVEAATRRNDVLYFWSTLIVEKAMRDGYVIHNKDAEQPDWFKEFWNLNWIDNIIRGVVYERKYGATTFTLFDEGSLIPFKPDNVEFKIDRYGDFTAFRLKEEVGGYQLPIYHYAGDIDEFQIPEDDVEHDVGELEDIFHEVLRPSDKKYEGISVVEPIWDLVQIRDICLQCMGINTARVASGIRKATVEVRDDQTEDDTVVALMELGLSRLEADDMSITLRSGTTPEGHKWEDKLEVDTGGSQYNYAEKIEICHKGLSIATGIPKNWFDGIFYGSLYASDSILQMLQTSLKTIQDQWSNRIEKMIQRWCEISGKVWQDDYKLVWNLKPKLTEKEEAELELIKAQTQATLKNSGIIDVEDARENLNLKSKEIEQPRNPFDINVEGLNDEEKKEPQIEGEE